MSNGILSLSNETLQMLSLKRPEAQQDHHEVILQGPKRQIVLFMKTLMNI